MSKLTFAPVIVHTFSPTNVRRANTVEQRGQPTLFSKASMSTKPKFTAANYSVLRYAVVVMNNKYSS